MPFLKRNYDNLNCRSIFSLFSVSLDKEPKEPQLTIKILKKKKKYDGYAKQI